MDREKVLKGLELCQQGFDCPSDCPYLDDCSDLRKPMFIELAKDALALLKEHEARELTMEEWRKWMYTTFASQSAAIIKEPN